MNSSVIYFEILRKCNFYSFSLNTKHEARRLRCQVVMVSASNNKLFCPNLRPNLMTSCSAAWVYFRLQIISHHQREYTESVLNLFITIDIRVFFFIILKYKLMCNIESQLLK